MGVGTLAVELVLIWICKVYAYVLSVINLFELRLYYY
jgi:hypothetical protein